jgi:hypothetical protein
LYGLSAQQDEAASSGWHITTFDSTIMCMEDTSMDFIEALPKVDSKSVMLTVVDHFSKYAQFIPLAHPYTVEYVADKGITNSENKTVCCLHTPL